MECLAQVLIKGVEKDIFDGQRVEVLAVRVCQKRRWECEEMCIQRKKMFFKTPNKNKGSLNVYPIISKEQPINPSANRGY